jgi:hypothetical protein
MRNTNLEEPADEGEGEGEGSPSEDGPRGQMCRDQPTQFFLNMTFCKLVSSVYLSDCGLYSVRGPVGEYVYTTS